MDKDQRLSRTWARSGAMGLSGRSAGPALLVPRQLVSIAEDAASTIATISERIGSLVVVDGPALLGERAALAGGSRRGDISYGGAARLLAARDGWVGLSLARESDVELVPAWLERPMPVASEALWHEIAVAGRDQSAADLVERASLLGMPVSRLGEVAAGGDGPVRVSGVGPADRGRRHSLTDAIVVDLSSLWAGPLCANLLGLGGARVIKVESSHRPDGARLGSRPFFDLLHAGHENVALDFRDTADRSALRRLVHAADVVIESSRPRAFEQLGLEPRSDAGPAVWVSITAYGRDDDVAHRVGFGDDAAVAGGLVTRDEEGPCFCADAVADPLTGLLAASASMQALESGARVRVDVALSRSAAWASTGPLITPPDEPPSPPRHRPNIGIAAELGAHTDAVIRELAS